MEAADAGSGDTRAREIIGVRAVVGPAETTTPRPEQLLTLIPEEAVASALDQAETLLFIADLFNYFFTRQKKAEFSIASS